MSTSVLQDLFMKLILRYIKIFQFTFFQAPYHDPRTKLRYANTEVFKQIRSLPNEYVQSYLALRNAAVVLR